MRDNLYLFFLLNGNKNYITTFDLYYRNMNITAEENKIMKH